MKLKFVVSRSFWVVLFYALSFVLFSGRAYSQTDDGTSKDINVDATTQTPESVKTELVCPVSGNKIEEGKGVRFSYLGTEYVFDSEASLEKFKKEPMDYIKGEIQCPVMSDAAEKDLFVVHDGVKYYFCRESCVRKFGKNPDKYLSQYNKEENK